MNLFTELDRLPVSKLFTYITIINNFFKTEYKDEVEHDTHTRQITNHIYRVPKINNDYGRQTLQYIIPSTFNTLPLNIRTLTKYKQIKTAVKTFLLDSQ